MIFVRYSYDFIEMCTFHKFRPGMQFISHNMRPTGVQMYDDRTMIASQKKITCDFLNIGTDLRKGSQTSTDFFYEAPFVTCTLLSTEAILSKQKSKM